MRSTVLVLAVTAVLAAPMAPAAAQLSVGTGNAPTTGRLPLGDNRAQFTQTFRAPRGATALRSITFDFLGSRMGSFWYDTRFLVGFGSCCNDFFQMSLDQSQHGRYTVEIGGVPVRAGDQLFFTFASEVNAMFANRELRRGYNDRTGNWLPRVPDYGQASVGLTDRKAYRDGSLDGDPDHQVAFNAQFTGTTLTPEPATLTLLAGGLAGLAAFKRKRKKQAEPEA